MRKFGLAAVCAALFPLLVSPASQADEKKWTTIKGTIVLDKDTPVPVMAQIVPMKDKVVCLADGKYFDESMIVDPKTRAMTNVFVWIEPEENARGTPFPQNLIHPKLAKPENNVEIDQPCCKFIPHVLAIREGQKLTIKNSAPIPHNAKWSSIFNGGFNPLIAPKGKHVIENLVAEKDPATISCSIHPEMQAWVRIFDHPYFAVTDEKGNFEIKLAPEGKFRMYLWQERGGWNGGRLGAKGTVIEIKGETMEMKEISYKPAK